MEILENKIELLDCFIKLNEEWISNHFQLEDADFKLAQNPQSIINDGGYIFSLVIDKQVVGVCALFNDGEGIYELARMAVCSRCRNLGYGSKLMEVAIQKLKDIKAKKVYLLSNTKLEPAIKLYKKYCFNVISEGQHPIYARANIVLQRSF